MSEDTTISETEVDTARASAPPTSPASQFASQTPEPNTALTQGVTQGGLGQQMRAARENMGVSLEEMSSHLRLTEHRIQALEDGRYDVLPEAAFVKGYIRGYARVVEVDPEPWVSEYTQLFRSEIELKQAVLPEKDSSSGAGGWFAVLAVVMLLSAGGWYYYQQVGLEGLLGNQSSESIESTAPEASDTRSDATRASDDPAAKDAESLAASESSGVIEPLASLTADPDLSAESASAVSSPVSSVSAGVRDSNATGLSTPSLSVEPQAPAPLTPPQTAPTEPVAAVAPVAEPVGGADASLPPNPDPALSSTDSEGAVESGSETLASNAAPTTVEEAAPRSALEQDVLELSTDFKSWVEIRDAEDERLMFGMLRADRARRLSGRAPFSVFLGNAPAVQMTVNGLPVERPRFNAEKNTARFTVAPNGSITN